MWTLESSISKFKKYIFCDPCELVEKLALAEISLTILEKTQKQEQCRLYMEKDIKWSLG